jgi:uncharacterized protein (TIGR03067 family)
MKALTFPAFFAIVLLPVTFALAEESDEVKKDMAVLQGEWKMVSGSSDGQPMPQEMLKQMKRIFKADELTVMMGAQTFFKAKITLDPSKTPKAINYDMTEGPTKGKKQLGIYELEGDTFKACFSPPDAERPADFTSKAGERRTLSVWKRQKEDAAQPAEKK